MSQGKKREVNGILKQILETDKVLTKKFVTLANNYLPFRQLKTHYKMLEISCHGVPWFAFWIAFMYLITSEHLLQLQVNMFLGLLIDVIAIAVIKAFTRRRRPEPNNDDIFGRHGPDKFSFPSGHASRSTFITLFFICLYEIPFPLYLPFIAWTVSVCLSRVLLYRHYILDIIGGVAVGTINCLLIGLLWLDVDACKYIYSLLSDEKFEGASYHV